MSGVLTARQQLRLKKAVHRRSNGRLTLAHTRLSEIEATALWRALCAPRYDDQRDRSLLSARDLAVFRRALATRSRQMLSCAAAPVTVAEARGIWTAACALADVRPAIPPEQRYGRAGVASVLIASLPLTGCTTLLGGHVKGSFSCSAPGGTCAPSTVIDDSALSLIQNARPMTPAARPWSQPPMRGEGKVVAVAKGIAHRERRVLKIVFPAFVDQRGYLHEPRVVHAVADQGGWMQTAEAAAAVPVLAARLDPNNGASLQPAEPSLGSSAAEEPANPILGTDLTGPDPAKVAAARARAKAMLPTTTEDIKAAVAAQFKAPVARNGSQTAHGDGSATQNARPAAPIASDQGATEPVQHSPQAEASVRDAVAQAKPNAPSVFPGRVED